MLIKNWYFASYGSLVYQRTFTIPGFWIIRLNNEFIFRDFLVQHALKDLSWRLSRTLSQQRIYLFPTAVFLLLSKQMWLLTNLKWVFDIIAPKRKWLSFQNSLSVIWRFTPSIPRKYINRSNASISTLSAFLTDVYLLDLLKLSFPCKRAIVLFILVFA